MLIEVQRKWETENSVCGEMFLDGIRQCYTLEPARHTPVHPGHPCITAGTFKVKLTMSPHMHYVTPELIDVPGRTAIRIHIANFPKDLLGCTAVGVTHSTDYVGASKLAFKALMLNLNGEDDIQITYTERFNKIPPTGDQHIG